MNKTAKTHKSAKTITTWQLGMVIIVVALYSCNTQAPKEVKNAIVTTDTVNKETVIDTAAILKRNRQTGEFWIVSDEKLSDTILRMVPPSELVLMRNEIFARYGYKFKNKDLKNYFDSTNWYVPLYDDVNHLLTNIELHNIAIMLQCEKISEDDWFNYFVEHLYEAKYPHKLIQKYIGDFRESPLQVFGGFRESPLQVFNKSKNKRYFLVLVRECASCILCNEVVIRIYSKSGNYIDLFTIEHNQNCCPEDAWGDCPPIIESKINELDKITDSSLVLMHFKYRKEDGKVVEQTDTTYEYFYLRADTLVREFVSKDVYLKL